jgi:tripartite-type tricarboxylate transporter receptor subunit TctC
MIRRVLAQSKYPKRPIRLVIPFAPGGAADAIGRPWADRMDALLGTVIVENQGGAGGVVGTAAVARAQPDGYAILLGSAGPQVLMPIAGNAPYDPSRDFTPISILVVTSGSIIVHPSVPARNLNELVAYAKANPGKLSYGTPGPGSMNRLSVELFKSMAGINDIVHVPYKGGGPVTSDLIGGQILMAALNVTGQVLELHRSGKVKMLAVTAPARVIAAPDIPTAIEQGFPNLVSQNFFGLFAPAGTPTAIVGQISDATHAAMADDEFRERLIASGFEPYLDSSPEAAKRYVKEEVDRWRPVVMAIGLWSSR